jgi:hypothetical protein
MNPNHPEFKEPRLAPIRYVLEEYDPAGMDGIAIIECELDVDVVRNEPVISGISFPANNKPNCMVPSTFELALIKILEADKWIMDDITRLCIEAYNDDFEEDF